MVVHRTLRIALAAGITLAPVVARAAEPAPLALEPIVVRGGSTALGDPDLLAPDPARAPVDVRAFAPRERLPATRLADVLERDPAVAENYATAGYYENFSIRGFTLDLGSAYRINGFPVPGELHTGLDNKERIEVLHGIAHGDGGATSAGGLVNFVTKRAEHARTVRLDANHWGEGAVSFDFGRAASPDVPLGLRLNAADATLASFVPHARGARQFASLALDLAGRDWSVTADLETQRRRQPAVPGFQLLGGTTLAPLAVTRVNINDQPWTRPVTNDATFAGLRASWRLAPDWSASAGASNGRARIEDNLAFPFGCNDPPVQYFCANGDYVLYDYHASEVRETTALQAQLAGRFRAAGFDHAVRIALEDAVRRIRQWNYWSNTLYDAGGRGLTGNIFAPGVALDDPPQTPVERPTTHNRQRSIAIGETATRGPLEARAGLRLARIDQQPVDRHGDYALPFAGLAYGTLAGGRLHASLAQGIDFGTEAPAIAENAGELLAPRRTLQAEIGWRRAFAVRSTVALTLFAMRRPFEFTESTGSSFAGLGRYRQAGQQTHRGLAIHAAHTFSAATGVQWGLAWIDTRIDGTGQAAYDGARTQNVPRVRSDLAVSHRLTIVEIGARWLHVGARSARRDGLVTAPGYDRIDLQAALRVRARGTEASLHLAMINATDRRYWRDVGEAYSAELLFPGAPRTIALVVALSAP